MLKKIIKKCEWCGNEFEAKTIYIKTCCSSCSRKLASKVAKERGHTFKRIYNVDDNFLERESNEKYYFLGLMASDGNVCKSSISISQSKEEGLKLLQYIKKLIKAQNPIYEGMNKVNNPVYCISLRSKGLMQSLATNNIVPNKTKIFTIPEYIVINENKLRYFLIGYIDGDGCIGVYSYSNGKKYLHVSFVATPMMIDQIISLSTFKYAHIIKKSETLSEIRFTGTDALLFAEWLYKDMDKNIFKSYKVMKYKSYLQEMDSTFSKSNAILTGKQVLEYLSEVGLESPLASGKAIVEKFNISLDKAYHLRSRWRKENE